MLLYLRDWTGGAICTFVTIGQERRARRDLLKQVLRCHAHLRLPGDGRTLEKTVHPGVVGRWKLEPQQVALHIKVARTVRKHSMFDLDGDQVGSISELNLQWEYMRGIHLFHSELKGGTIPGDG
jgi:hypothetical protein